MISGRLFIQLVAIIWFLICPCIASAGWWFSDDNDWEKSGLDLEKSYDRNTVISVKGKIIKTDLNGTSGPALAEIKTPKEILTLVLGPGDFWNKSGISLNEGDDVEARGSRAQGKNGKLYLIVENISSSSEPDKIILRNETGRPSWAGRNRPERQRAAPMRQFRGGRNR